MKHYHHGHEMCIFNDKERTCIFAYTISVLTIAAVLLLGVRDAKHVFFGREKRATFAFLSCALSAVDVAVTATMLIMYSVEHASMSSGYHQVVLQGRNGVPQLLEIWDHRSGTSELLLGLCLGSIFVWVRDFDWTKIVRLLQRAGFFLRFHERQPKCVVTSSHGPGASNYCCHFSCRLFSLFSTPRESFSSTGPLLHPTTILQYATQNFRLMTSDIPHTHHDIWYDLAEWPLLR